ncbi:MAG: T9SS type A sorting domain-containing protein [bacterium]|nr:T9SS type A sorting domain-containing protein [bacterium]
MPVHNKILAHLLVWVSVGTAWAAVLRVPSDYQTIQLALDAIESGDTVVVASGIYSEALYAPPVDFALIGDVVPDSQLVNLPVVDPSSLLHSEELACLTIEQPLSQILIERIAFRNGPQMYPRNVAGGIVGNVLHLHLTSCLFDSTYYGIARAAGANEQIELDSCRFMNNPVGCVSAEEHQVSARNSLFDGGGFALINCGAGSSVLNCDFRGSPAGYALLMSGDSLLVSECAFSGNAPEANAWIAWADGSGSITYNLFEAGQFVFFGVHVSRVCTEPLWIVGNIFRQLFEITPIVIECEVAGGEVAHVDSNLFVGIVTHRAKAIQIEPNVPVVMNSNRFNSLSPSDRATVFSTGQQVFARENIFSGNGLAYWSSEPNDARFNYWGDSTGPYHPVLNPDGLGDSVSDSVNFEPWYPDTSFLIDAAREHGTLAREFALAVYPNPFNSVATIALDIPDVFVGSVEVLNILGERVTELHRGPLFGHHEFALRADRLASGVYFIRVRDIVRHSVNFSQKVLLIR